MWVLWRDHNMKWNSATVSCCWKWGRKRRHHLFKESVFSPLLAQGPGKKSNLPLLFLSSLYSHIMQCHHQQTFIQTHVELMRCGHCISTVYCCNHLVKKYRECSHDYMIHSRPHSYLIFKICMETSGWKLTLMIIFTWVVSCSHLRFKCLTSQMKILFLCVQCCTGVVWSRWQIPLFRVVPPRCLGRCFSSVQ